MNRLFSYALALVILAGPRPAWAGPPEPAEPPPAGPQLLLFPDEPFRATPPVIGQPKGVKPPKPQIWRWKHAGLDVVLVERHDLPTIALDLRLRGGSVQDPPQQEGRAAVCMALLTEGSAGKDKLQLAEAIGDLGVGLQSWAGVDEQGLGMTVLSPRLGEALDLLRDVLAQQQPRDDEHGRQLARRIAALQAQRGSAAALAGRVQPALAYGRSHPRGRVVTAASLGKLTPADCAAHWSSLSLQGGTLYIVGDIGKKQIDALLQPVLAPKPVKGASVAPQLLQAAAAPEVAIGSPVAPTGRLFFVEVAKAEQSVIVVQHPGPQRNAADYEATSLLSAVLSGGFSSRINMNLREQHGWAYGAGGGFRYVQEGSVLAISASVRRDATGPAIGEILREMARIHTEPPTEAELAREREGTILALPARWSTGQSTLSSWATLRYFGLPLGWYDQLPERLRKADTTAVAKAAQHIQPDKAQILVVGDASVRSQLEALQAEGQSLAGTELVRLGPDAEVLP